MSRDCFVFSCLKSHLKTKQPMLWGFCGIIVRVVSCYNIVPQFDVYREM